MFRLTEHSYRYIHSIYIYIYIYVLLAIWSVLFKIDDEKIIDWFKSVIHSVGVDLYLNFIKYF